MQQLGIDILIPDDGAGNALVEQTHIQQQRGKAPLGLHLAAVHVHHIGQQLERVKRNADGQRDLQNLVGEAQKVMGVFHKECAVLKNPQQAQVYDTGQHHAPFGGGAARRLAANVI